MRRSVIKKNALKNLKKHYFLFAFICVFASYLGVEFVDSALLSELHNIDYYTEKLEQDNYYYTERFNQDKLPIDYDKYTGEFIIGSLDSRVYNAIMEAASGNKTEGRKIVKEITEEKKIESDVTPSLGRRAGFLANVVNNISSGSFLVEIASLIFSLSGSPTVSKAIIFFISLAFLIFLQSFVFEVYGVVVCRIFLEGRTYEKAALPRFLFLFKIKKWVKTSLSLLLSSFYQFLWSLTVVGIFIKHYSYFLVPYILAENPDIGPKNAIKLSRNMMNGYKRKCFLYEISFLGWKLLSFFTLGLTGLFFSNPYQKAFFTDFYVEVRKQAKENKIPLVEKLYDKYLYEIPSTEVLNAAYPELDKVMDLEKNKPEPMIGLSGFLYKWLGIILIDNEKSRKLEAYKAERVHMKRVTLICEKKVYPGRLYPLEETEKRMWLDHITYLRSYSLSSIAIMFFATSFFGWIWEVCYHVVTTGNLVNRGVLHGPWLPIYGFGGILILVILNRVRLHPFLELFSAVVLCGFVEYATGTFLEYTHGGTKWWDYSGYFLNIKGRVCAEGLAIFGLGGVAFVYIVAPLLDNYIKRIKRSSQLGIAIVLMVIFLSDVVISGIKPNTGRGITDTSSVKTEIREECLIYNTYTANQKIYLANI